MQGAAVGCHKDVDAADAGQRCWAKLQAMGMTGDLQFIPLTILVILAERNVLQLPIPLEFLLHFGFLMSKRSMHCLSMINLAQSSLQHQFL